MGVTKKYLFLLLAGLLCFSSIKAQLVINEVSQGYSGNQEYVELLVVGTPTCNSIPCMDLRGYYIDDNNGNHATGAGVGIAQGCVRFTTDALWSCVPVGTLILIYNDADLNPDVPAQDLSLTDGNCKLVIPISNCTLFERNTSTPSTAVATYPTTGFSACGNWGNISMANGGDSFQSIDPSGSQVFSVSWGNNSVADVIYFAAGQTGMVCSMTNSTDNNPFTQSNWVSQAVAGNQTPGSPNNAANAAWINSMNNSCTALTPLLVSNAVTNAGCTCTGSATVTASGAIGPYTYSWAPAGGTSATASALCAGDYTVTATSANGCSQTTTLSIVSISPITTSITATNVSCNGGSNGSATLTANNTSGAVTYSWTPSGGNGTTAPGLNAGNYTVNVLDAAGCTATATVTITEPPALTVTPTQTNALCNGASNGSASVNASGGTGPYTYTWSPSGGNSSTATGLSSGNYSCTASDANGCAQLQSFTITQPPALTITPTQTNVACNGGANGSAAVSVSGGTGAYSYTWSPAGGNAASSTGLNAGNYSVDVTDANGCAISQAFTITEPGSIVVTPTQTNVSCNGGTNGAANVSATGGTGAYSYSWQPSGGTSTTASGLSAGSYTCTITDANTCTTIQTFSISSPTAMTITPTQTNVSCNGGSNGTASINVSGGTGAYTYSWSPSGGNSALALALAAGTYTVLVNDANGCTVSQTFSLTQPTPLSIVPSQTNVACNGASSGVASATVSGGTAPYTYTWSPLGGNISTANNLPAGGYTADVTDANGCAASQNFSITQPAALTVTVTNTVATCGNSNGTALAAVSGGTGAYTYAWTPTGGNAAGANGLATGNYSVTVSDANGCAITGTTSIVNIGGATVSATSTSVSCFGGNDGSASANAASGATPYTYSWSPSGGTNSAASTLTAGNYTVSVTDSVGCTTTATTSVLQPTAITLTVTSINVSCFGGSNGSASVNASGGAGAFSYSWLPTGGNAASATNLAAGNYSVTVTDANGCSAVSSATINEPSALSVSTSTTAISCNGGSNGSITATANGGTPGYSYVWQPSGGVATTASSLAAGTYTVLVTDSNGCTQNMVATLSQPQAISVTLTTTPVTCGTNNGAASSNVSGGTGPYSYAWLPAGGNAANASALAAGNYTLVVTDNNGCVKADTATVQNMATLSVSVSTTSVTCNAGSNGSASAIASGGSAPYTYAWSGAGSTATINNLAAGSYTVTLTDATGCVLSATTTVTQPPALSLTVTSVTVCSGQTATITGAASGGVAPYQYSFSGASWQASNSFTVAPPSSSGYTVQAMDNNGCVSPTASAQITVLPPLQVTTGDALVCPGTNAILTANASGGNGNYTYSWQPGNLGGSSISVTAQTTTIYTVTVSDGCTTVNASDTGKISVYPTVTPTLAPTLSGCAPLCVNFTVSSSANIINYQWNFGDNTSSGGLNPSHCYTNAGTYNVALTYTTTQGCANTVVSNGMVHVFGKPVAAFVPSAYEASTFDPNITFYDQSTGGVTSWQWNFGDGSASVSQNPTHNYANSGDYTTWLLVANQYGCKDSVSVEIRIKEDFLFYAPNAFTPDGDELNDSFLPTGIGWDIATYQLSVYDRWGNLVYATHDVSHGWDGTRHGELVQQDTYVWKAEVKDLYGGLHQYNGVVSVVR